LPAGAVVGTSSPRRACQLRVLRRDLRVRDVRGNVDTRLRKLEAGEYDALLLAAAGLHRLGMAARITEYLPADVMIPAVSQGALALEVRADDTDALAAVRPLDHAPTRAAVTAERAFLARLGAGCTAPAGAHATVTAEGTVRVLAMVGTLDPTTPEREEVRLLAHGPVADPAQVGRAAAEEIITLGGDLLLAAAGRARAPA